MHGTVHASVKILKMRFPIFRKCSYCSMLGEKMSQKLSSFSILFLCFKCCSVNTYMWNQCWHSVHCIQSILPFPLRAVGGEVSWHM